MYFLMLSTEFYTYTMYDYAILHCCELCVHLLSPDHVYHKIIFFKSSIFLDFFGLVNTWLIFATAVTMADVYNR